jgi:AcrR family transcriptional regulator
MELSDEAPRTRRRGERLEHAIFDAVWHELRDTGATQVTVAGVAARAGTSKAVLYRRWPNRFDLIAAALDHRLPELRSDPPDTGSLREDVLLLLRRLSHRYKEVQRIPGQDRELSTHLRQRASQAATGQLDDVLRRAVERAEISHDPMPRIAHLPVDLVHHQVFLTDQPLVEGDLLEIVDDVFLPLVHRTVTAGQADA